MYILIPIICPIIVLIAGYLLKKFPPKDANSLIGYKTKMSKKNTKTWNVANSLATELFITFSWLSLFIVLVTSFMLGKEQLLFEVFLGIILLLISIIITVLLTERHLKNTFGK